MNRSVGGYGLQRLRKKWMREARFPKKHLSAAKAGLLLQLLAARLKSGPGYKAPCGEFFRRLFSLARKRTTCAGLR